jgi:hypothetical protein
VFAGYERFAKNARGMSVDDAIATASQRFENFDYGEMQLGVIVWENCHARLPLSRELFTGQYDERYGLMDSHIQRIFCGGGMAEVETA